MDDRRISNLGTGVGLVFGTLVGAPASILTGEVLSSLSYGLGGGIIVGALAGRLVRANTGKSEFGVRVVGGSGTVGAVVGAGVGAVGAWSVDIPATTGTLLGSGVGLLHGLLVGVLLLVTVSRELTDSV
jgi:hypothetical protein